MELAFAAESEYIVTHDPRPLSGLHHGNQALQFMSTRSPSRLSRMPHSTFSVPRSLPNALPGDDDASQHTSILSGFQNRYTNITQNPVSDFLIHLSENTLDALVELPDTIARVPETTLSLFREAPICVNYILDRIDQLHLFDDSI